MTEQTVHQIDVVINTNARKGYEDLSNLANKFIEVKSKTLEALSANEKISKSYENLSKILSDISEKINKAMEDNVRLLNTLSSNSSISSRSIAKYAKDVKKLGEAFQFAKTKGEEASVAISNVSSDKKTDNSQSSATNPLVVIGSNGSVDVSNEGNQKRGIKSSKDKIEGDDESIKIKQKVDRYNSALKESREIIARVKKAHQDYLDLVNKRISKNIELTKSMFNSLIGFSAITIAMNKVSSAIISIGNVSRNTGRSVGDLKGYSVAVAALGGDFDQAIQSAQQFSDLTESLKYGMNTDFTKNLAMLGVSPFDRDGTTKGQLDLIKELHQKTKSMTPQRAHFLLSNAGFNEDQINLILRYNDKIDKLIKDQKNYNKQTKESYESAIEYNTALAKLKSSLSNLGVVIGKLFIPIMEKLSNVLSSVARFASNHENLVTIGAALVGIALSASVVGKSIGLLASVFRILVSTGSMLASSIATIATKLSFLWTIISDIAIAISTWVIANPIILAIGAALSAVVLIIQDIYSYFKGIPSLTGGIVSGFKAMGNWLESIFDSAIEKIQWIIDKLSFNGIGSAFKRFFGIGEDSDGYTGATDRSNNLITPQSQIQRISQRSLILNKMLGGYNIAPLSSMHSTTNSNSGSYSITVNPTIHANNLTPEASTKAVQDGISSAITKGIAQLNTGVIN